MAIEARINDRRSKNKLLQKQGSEVFRVEIPVLHIDENNLFRAGNTVQKEK